MFLVADLIKFCILALEENVCQNDKQIIQPKYNVNEVLRHTLQLIPFEEHQFIDQVIELLENLNDEIEKK